MQLQITNVEEERQKSINIEDSSPINTNKTNNK